MLVDYSFVIMTKLGEQLKQKLYEKKYKLLLALNYCESTCVGINYSGLNKCYMFVGS